MTWPRPRGVFSSAGLALIADAPRPPSFALALTRTILTDNPRVEPFAALTMAVACGRVAREAGIDEGFLAATLLQESAFAPDAISSAGAVGIGQFTIETADAYGVDPFAWRSAMVGSAHLLARYLQAYRGRYDDPFAAALAAYNAGPEAVARYGGIPPYPETRGYVIDIYERWSRLERDAGLRS